jgi:hypothetical protein
MTQSREKTLVTLNSITFYELNELTRFDQKLHIAKEISKSHGDRKIAAIKLFRNIFGVGLKEAKDFIDAFMLNRRQEDGSLALTSSESTLAMLENLKLQYDTCKESDVNDIPF